MAELFLILFFIYLMKKSPRDRRNSDMGKRLILGFFLFCVALPILAELLPALAGLAVFAGFGAMVWYLVKTIKEQKASDKRSQQYGWDPQRWTRDSNTTYQQTGTYNQGTGYQQKTTYSQSTSYQQTGTYNQGTSYQQRTTYNQGTGSRQTSAYNNTAYSQNAYTSLPRSVKKRRKILDAFNEKYRLDLTDEQKNSIVNSSYMSAVWRRELEAMDQRYETVYEWMQGPTAWLRAYMYVFHIQEITSDIRQQEEICMYTFETVFQYVDSLNGIPQNKKIEMVNNKYFTSFDDVSFMMAYRFLESKGLNHDLKSADLAENADSAEDLVNRYAPQEEKLGL